MPQNVDLLSAMAIAERAALAPEHVFRTVPSVVVQQGRDIKLRQDIAAEQAVIDKIKSLSSLPILSEESGWVGTPAEGDDHYWIVDPLDGSFNFSRGIPLYCTSVALCSGSNALAGAIYHPAQNELFSGAVGCGFHVNGQPQEPYYGVSQIIGTGVPSHANLDEVGRDIVAMLPAWKKIRMIGSAALSLAWMAAGRIDAYQEIDIQWWDVAAGIALVKAAGIQNISVVPTKEKRMSVSVIRSLSAPISPAISRLAT